MVLKGNNIMTQNPIGDAADGLLRLYKEEFRGPFPYADCRKLLHEEHEDYEGLIPNLDMYFSTVAGYCTWGRRILELPKEKIQQATAQIQRSFFDKHPQYRPLTTLITKTNTPNLYAKIMLCERLRTNLLEIFSQLV